MVSTFVLILGHNSTFLDNVYNSCFCCNYCKPSDISGAFAIKSVTESRLLSQSEGHVDYLEKCRFLPRLNNERPGQFMVKDQED
ncbi:Alpha/Beta hydrolase fold-containing protein [Dioscorea alata]|uniref:Alpha/Beta hydrolase fold-containing protein n=1 Tax=Dioscorea alata TaxID=55571 RepID=A0ACB7VVX6_DIOAL|nr:Alpha/Beta hydrolase fold-containing protein [Dioscorea alata]